MLDLDPPEGDGFAAAVLADRDSSGRCSNIAGLSCVVKTSGAKGVHVFVPVSGASLDEAAAATRAIAARAEALDPAVATTAFMKEDREGKVFVDTTHVGGATVVAAYSPRVRPGTPVSFPVRWDDLDDVAPGDFTLHTVPGHLDAAGPWLGDLAVDQAIPADLVEEGTAIAPAGSRPCTRASDAEHRRG